MTPRTCYASSFLTNRGSPRLAVWLDRPPSKEEADPTAWDTCHASDHAVRVLASVATLEPVKVVMVSGTYAERWWATMAARKAAATRDLAATAAAGGGR